MTYREINIPIFVEPEAAYEHFDVRFTGALSEVESELALGMAKGAAPWCKAFRDIHDGDRAQLAPIGMLKEFADDAPSLFLRGYVLGIMFVRKKPRPLEMPLTEWVARASGVHDPEIRGMAMACAVMAVLGEGGTLLPNRPNRPSRPSRSNRRGAGVRSGRSTRRSRNHS